MQNKAKKIFWAFAILFVLACFYSAATEEMIPMYKAGEYNRFWAHVIGVPIAVTGALIVTYGGVLFVKQILFVMFKDPEVIKNMQYVVNHKHLKIKNPKEFKRARNQNLKSFLHYSKVPFMYLLFGFLLIAAGGITINYQTYFNF